jgi:PadR family transcriptional regulator, regulatory protein PadR
MSLANPELFQGTLDLLVLKALSLRAMHGWGVAQRLQQISGGVLEVNQGSLYPALHRLERKGFVDAEWRTSEHNRRARYYHLTAAGRRALGDEARSWATYATAVARVLGATAETA